MVRKLGQQQHGGGGGGGKKRPAPFNAYVRRDREEKFQEKKRVLSRFRRFQRYEERQAGDGAAETADPVLHRAMAMGQDALDEEYERALELSFGAGNPEPDDAAIRNRKKKGKRKRGGAEPEAEAEADAAAEAAPEADAAAVRSKKGKKRKAAAEAAQDGDAAQGAAGGEARRGSGRAAAPQPEAAEPPAEQSGRRRGRPDPKGVKQQTPAPARFAKAMRKYDEAQEVKAAERRRIEDEMQQRNSKRKEGSRQRAVKGQLLNKKTARGQPNMQNMLEMLTNKLVQEKAASGVKAKR